MTKVYGKNVAMGIQTSKVSRTTLNIAGMDEEGVKSAYVGEKGVYYAMLYFFIA